MSRKEENKMKTGNKHEQGWVYILTNPSFREDQGAKYFSYNGRILDDIRHDMESSDVVE